MTTSTQSTTPETTPETASTSARRVSAMAEGLAGSEILKIAAEIRALAAQGAEICNLTVGDFAPAQFRIPRALEDGIAAALVAGETNYPPSDGMLALREAIRRFYERRLGLAYPLESVLVTAGARPGIYATYRALVDPGDTVVAPAPSWNNNYYVQMVGARGVVVPSAARDAFLPTRAALETAVRGARLLVLNSPLNPTGTAFTAEQLAGICDLVLEENARRATDERPLFLMYDQVYWTLTFGATTHVTPVGLRPALRDYTVFVDGVSKALAATGVRVGWVVGPADVVGRMASIVGHMGAWAPRAEQVAVARLLDDDAAIDAYQAELKQGLAARLDALHEGLRALAAEGHPLETIAPMGAIYLTARFALHGRRTAEGAVLRTNEDVRRWLLAAAGLAVVPFQAFDMREESGWFRLSVGAASVAEIRATLARLGPALASLR
ncbi:MAG TPA: aminotransferase class I/II-fold pyridoxal phosphate-dependent enzyme [Gemmatimonadales bacterium]|nr:aminotransferase class I/II-fold pyridoxal phosphate-dependent enzyme [Gemmatimonadales bacterium]